MNNVFTLLSGAGNPSRVLAHATPIENFVDACGRRHGRRLQLMGGAERLGSGLSTD
jgi:hypothetical protein